MNKNKILVTGGSGRFAKILKKKNYKLNLYFASKKECNILNENSIVKIIKKIKPSIILHTAGLSRPMNIHETNISKSIDLNIIGTANLVKICKKFNIKYVILRFGTVYGERANKFNTVQNFINEGKKNLKIFRETKGNEVRSYIHVKDVTKIVIESNKKKYENGYYNIFGNKKTLVKNLLNIIKSKIPGLKIFYSKRDKRKYNYKINPFTYKLRKGKIIKLKKYINLENGISTLVNRKY